MNWDYIAGFFDGEGSIVKIATKSYRISFAQSDTNVLEVIANFLNEYGIHTWITYKQPTALTRKPEYQLAFSQSTSVRLFLKTIQDRIIVKKDLVNYALDNLTNRITTSVSETERQDMIAMDKDGLSQHEIANILGRSQFAVSTNLRRRLCP